MSLKSVILFGSVILHYLIMIVTIFPYWRNSTPKLSDGIYRVWGSWEGIWWRCTAKKQGEMWCDFHKSPLFKLSAELQSMRAMMCFACVFSFAAAILSILALDCVTAIERETKSKSLISIISSLLTLAAGTLMGVCTSWYGIDVYSEFKSSLYSHRQVGYEFGYCLYFGWVGTLMAAIVGLLMLYVGCAEMNEYRREDEDNKTYSYQPPSLRKIDKPQYV